MSTTGKRAMAPTAERDWIVPRRIVSGTDSRSSALADVQLVCGAGEYELDVLVREIAASQVLEVGGQITHRDALHAPVAQVPVTLVEERREAQIDLTQTDHFGEFGFSVGSSRRLGLVVGEGPDAPCVLVWEGS